MIIDDFEFHITKINDDSGKNCGYSKAKFKVVEEDNSKFKGLMKVRCIDNEVFENSLTINKEYPVKSELDVTYLIIDDKGEEKAYIKKRFEVVEKEIKMKISDFKKIEDIHFKVCKKIIEQGNCKGISCSCGCPFNIFNINNKNVGCDMHNVVNAAREFLKLKDTFKEYQEKIEENFGKIEENDIEEFTDKVEDVVNNPNHYKLNGLDIEVIQVIKAVLTKEEFRGFLKGNIIKYNLRANKKNGLQDYEKAAKYLKWLIEEIKGE